MGRQASLSIRKLCDNENILAPPPGFRDQLVKQGLSGAFPASRISAEEDVRLMYLIRRTLQTHQDQMGLPLS
jgi:hypothetical protein